MILGFVSASRLWDDLGVLVTHMVEPKLHNAKREVRWVSVLINFLLFVGLAVPFIYYFQVEADCLNWKTDLLGGVLAGFLLTFVQSTHWNGPKSRMLLHGAAMMAAFPMIMLVLRYLIHVGGCGFKSCRRFS